MSPEPLLITGDFNIHVDVPNDSNAARFLELLTSMGLEQHVNKPTHISGHTLDLIITRCSDSLLCAKPIADYLFSDHITVLCDLELGKPPPKLHPRCKFHFRYGTLNHATCNVYSPKAFEALIHILFSLLCLKYIFFYTHIVFFIVSEIYFLLVLSKR